MTPVLSNGTWKACRPQRYPPPKRLVDFDGACDEMDVDRESTELSMDEGMTDESMTDESLDESEAEEQDEFLPVVTLL